MLVSWKIFRKFERSLVTLVVIRGVGWILLRMVKLNPSVMVNPYSPAGPRPPKQEFIAPRISSVELIARYVTPLPSWS